jgi:hypothetical protein
LKGRAISGESTVLIGTSAQAGAFTEDIVSEIVKHVAWVLAISASDQVAVLALIVLVDSRELFANSQTMKWQRAKQTKLSSLRLRKRAALVQQRLVK